MATRLAARLVSVALVAMAACGFAAADTGASVTSVATQTLPPLPDDAPLIGVVTLQGRAAAIEAGGGWILAADKSRWNKVAWQPPGPEETIRTVISDGRQAFVLMGAEGIDRIARVELTGEALALRPLPALPMTLADARGVSQAGSVYLAGLDSAGKSQLLQLASGQWMAHAGWPGGGVPTSLVAQSFALYLTVRDRERTPDRVLRWSADDSWENRGDAPGVIVPGSGRAIGQAHVLFVVCNASDASELMTFHTIARAWAPLEYKGAGDVAAANAWGTGLLLARPSAGRIDFEAAEVKSARRPLRIADWIIVVVYLAGMLSVGVYFYIRAKKGSTADFFVGSRSIPFWAAGISIYATNTSSISYLATPAKAFETDWQYLTGKIVTVLGLMFVAVWVVPVLRRLNLVSVFNYLEMRFHPAIRMLASALCMAMHVGSRMSVVLFLPALAIATITGIDVVWSILIMGVCTIIYTTMGGMRAVVWTDVFQVIVLMGGALFAIGWVFHSLGGAEVYETALAYNKTRTFNFSFDLTEPTVWGFVLLILFDTVLTFPKDQVLMQRTLATSSDKNAGRSIWIFAAVLLPGGFMFYVIGTVLFAYYKAHPERMDPLLPIDATFPLFIAAELPTGVTGLIIAGIFSAAMGTLSSTINSVATLLSVDFYEKLARNPTQQKSVRFAEWMSVVIGLVGIGLALLLSMYDIHSLLDLTIELAGLLGGGFAGAYTLGMFTRRANWQGVVVGIATAIVVTLTAWVFRLVHPYFYLGISILVCIVVGYCASYLFPPPRASLEGLTVRIGKETVHLRAEVER